MSFFNELKRRNVFRVGAAYVVVSWLLLQIVDTLGSILSLSDGFGAAVFLVLVLGFPVVLIVTWVFELTPEGVQTQGEADNSGYKSSSNKLNTLIIAGLSLAVVILLLKDTMFVDGQSAVEETPAVAEADIFQEEIIATDDLEKTLAVLPFDDLSAEGDQEYFSDGLTEELINKLSQVDDLLVTGRNSSFYFKNREEDLAEIGEILGVAHVLQGSVRKSGDQIRITAQLMDAQEGFNLWSETFDRKLADIFNIQDEIAEAVTTSLQITLGAGDFARPGLTQNVEAYNENLIGFSLVNQITVETAFESLIYFERALTLDPTFAWPWLNMAFAKEQIAGLSSGLSAEQISRYREEAAYAREQAALHAPDMWEVQLRTAENFRTTGNWIAAEEIYQALFNRYGNSVVELNFSYQDALMAAGRTQEALFYAQQNRRLEPLQWSDGLGFLQTQLGEYEESIESLEVQFASNPDNIVPNVQLAFANVEIEDWEGAISATSHLISTRANQTRLLEYLRDGDIEGGISEVHDQLADEGISEIYLSRHLPYLTAALGAPELALEIMTNFVQENRREYGSVLSVVWLGKFSEARQLPAFKELVRELGLVDYWRVTGKWADLCRPLEGNDDFECF